MATNEYHFITHWRVPASCEEAYRTLQDINTLAAWWPSVYLDVKVLDKGLPGGVGKVVGLYTQGWLPYTLRWQFKVTKQVFPMVLHWMLWVILTAPVFGNLQKMATNAL